MISCCIFWSRRIGSDEDDEDEDETQSAEDLSETAVSRDAQKEQNAEDDKSAATKPGVEEVQDGGKEGASVTDEDKDKDEVEEAAAMNGEVSQGEGYV